MLANVFLTPIPLNKADLERKTVVVIDVLRSSTTICACLLAGARGVIPTEDPGDAGELRTRLGADAAVLAGERDGFKIENFQYGNSPAEFTSATVGDKTVILCTTNGTGIFARTAKAETILCGGLVNISRVAEEVARIDQDLVVVCAGREGGFSVEDTICAGMLIELLRTSHRKQILLNDAASLALMLYDRTRTSIPRAIAEGEHARFLASLGFADDVDLCTRVDSMPVLPLLKDGRLVKLD